MITTGDGRPGTDRCPEKARQIEQNLTGIVETTIFVPTIGDKTNFADCMSHLQRQTVCRRVEIIDHVAPMSAAFQQMHERCRTPYFVQVDEDMLLDPDAVERLEHLIRQSPPDVALMCVPLWDCDIQQPIHGLKIYRHEIVRRFPYEDRLSCELRQIEQIKAAGYAVSILPLTNRSDCFGVHGKHYTPETIFKRWQRICQKHHQYGGSVWAAPWPRKLLDRYVETREELHLYAMLGAIAGIASVPVPDREIDWRDCNDILSRMQRHFPSRNDCDTR